MINRRQSTKKTIENERERERETNKSKSIVSYDLKKRKYICVTLCLIELIGFEKIIERIAQGRNRETS